VDRAEIPSTPVKPRKSLNFVLSLFGGLVAGIGLAFFQEYMDNSIKSADDITHFFKLPTLGMIPKLQSISGSRKYGYGYGYGHMQALAKTDQNITIDLIAHKSPNSLMAEAYRSVRTSLLLSAPDHPPKSIVITSALPSEGKTATAVNTAVSLTQTGSRVILIDADMRKPRLHQIFGMKGDAGLSNFLSGAAGLKEVIHQTTVPNLFVVPCGAIPPNPAELILSNRLRRMIETLGQYFDFVILDSPPLLNVSDARILSTACEASILVVKAFSTSRHLVKRAVDDISPSTARLAGTVLNDIDVRSSSAYYPYHSSRYSYYSGYSAQGGRPS
jgi:capsular exopolysaccharide synthesis family protein